MTTKYYLQFHTTETIVLETERELCHLLFRKKQAEIEITNRTFSEVEFMAEYNEFIGRTCTLKRVDSLPPYSPPAWDKGRYLDQVQG